MQIQLLHKSSETGNPAACTSDDCLAGSGWSDLHAEAWLGMLQTYRQLTRDLDAELEARHGLSLTGLELLSHLAMVEERRLRLSTLADQIGLSVSGISRLVDTLEQAELVERRTCPEDGRAVNVFLTDAGLRLVGEAQATHFANVQRSFFDHVSAGELASLAEIFARFAPKGGV
jgi:DNA-binding MarR family transcriptional regulator